MGRAERSSVGPQPAPTKPSPGRRHPARLPDPLYREPYAVASVAIRGRQGVLLTSAGRPDAIVAAMLDVARRRGVRVHAYCLMPDHIHVVCSVGDSGGDVALWVRRLKSAASRRARVPLWQRSYRDRHARADEDVVRIVEYVLCNPVRRGLCSTWEEWPHSWSEWHARDG